MTGRSEAQDRYLGWSSNGSHSVLDIRSPSIGLVSALCVGLVLFGGVIRPVGEDGLFDDGSFGELGLELHEVDCLGDILINLQVQSSRSCLGIIRGSLRRWYSCFDLLGCRRFDRVYMLIRCGLNLSAGTSVVEVGGRTHRITFWVSAV